MGELIEALFANPFLLLLIIGGLISFFRRKEGANEDASAGKQQQQTRQEQQEKKPSAFEDFLGKLEGALSDDKEEPARPTPTEAPKQQQRTPVERPAEQRMTAQEHRMERMQQISDELQSGTYEEIDTGTNYIAHQGLRPDVPEERLNKLERKLRSDVKRRLSKKSLIDSIIMAEVLGEPRSRKPYENRNMNKNKLY